MLRRERTSRVTGTESRWTVALLRTPLSIGNPGARPRDTVYVSSSSTSTSSAQGLSDGGFLNRRNNLYQKTFLLQCAVG